MPPEVAILGWPEAADRHRPLVAEEALRAFPGHWVLNELNQEVFDTEDFP